MGQSSTNAAPEHIAPSDSLPTLLAHPAAEYFPLIEGEAFEALKTSIASTGLLMPITLCDGRILDGRNRYRACIELGIEPRFQNFQGESPVAGAWALNGERRHLTPSQRAAIAVKMLGPLKEEAKKRQEATGKNAPRNESGQLQPVPPEPAGPEEMRLGEAVLQAAKLVGVGKTVVQQAKAVQSAAPELFEKIESGEVSVDRAHKIITGRVKPPEPLGRNQPREKRAADITRLAAEGNNLDQIAEHMGIGTQQVRKIADAEKIVLPDDKIGKTRRINASRVIAETVSSLEGLTLGLQTIGMNFHVSAHDAREWAPSISQSLKSLSRLRNKLMEIARE